MDIRADPPGSSAGTTLVDLLSLPEERGAGFGRLLDGLPVGVYRTTPSGQILDANAALAQILGYLDVQALSRVTAGSVYLDPGARREWQARMDRDGEVHDFELQLRRPDGSTIWVRDSARAIRNAEGQIAFYEGVVEDITERKQAQEALRLSEEAARRILDAAHEAFIAVSADGRILNWNRQAEQTFGWSREEAIGQPFDELVIPPRFREANRRNLQQVLATGEGAFLNKRIELLAFHRQGHEFPVELTITPLDVGGTLTFNAFVHDITERKRAAEELERANASLTRWVAELEQRRNELVVLGEMGELLQTSLTVEEAFGILARRLPLLFTNRAGAIYALSASRKMVETLASWGTGLLTEPVFAPEDCWALRRGRTHLVRDAVLGPICAHFGGETPASSICVPMMAQGEALGVLVVQDVHAISPRGPDEADHDESVPRLAAMVAEQIAMAFANLKLRETLRHQSIRDSLTGLFNRRYMEETFERELKRADRRGVPVGMIMMDLDYFKRFNDTFGHLAGDSLLRAFGEFLQTNTRAEDVACRYGGEEFAVIMPEATLETTRRRADELREKAKELAVEHRGQLLGGVSFSAGVAAFPFHGSRADDVLRKADAALYHAKAEGRDRVVVAEIKQTSPKFP